MTLRSLFLIFLGFFISACSESQDEIKDQPQKEYKLEAWQKEFSDAEEKALVALDKIQISGWHFIRHSQITNTTVKGLLVLSK